MKKVMSTIFEFFIFIMIITTILATVDILYPDFLGIDTEDVISEIFDWVENVF